MHIRIGRRQFLQGVAGITAAGLAPQFMARAAESAARSRPIAGFDDDRVLVVVQLGGGNDGLNTVVPYGDDAYHRARPGLGLKRDRVLRVDDYVGFNDAMAGFMDLYDSGRAAVIQGVGYPNPDRSHFRSMEIWQTASDSDEQLGAGWIGRYFDNTCSGAAQPHAGVAVMNERPQAFDGRRGFGVAFQQPQRFGWRAGRGADDEQAFTRLNAARPSNNDTLDFLRKTTSQAIASVEEVREAAARAGLDGTGRSPLQTVAALIRGGLDTRLYYVDFGGFDTHANQANQHGRLLGRVAAGLAGFQATLRRDGTASRVATVVFSEFGRRVDENASGGTDHGTAAPMFLIGEGIRPGLHGAMPSLTDLDDGDLRHTVDFREVYAAALEQWLGVDSAPVLNGRFEPLRLFA